VKSSGTPNASYERHLVFDHVVESETSSLRERFEAVAHATLLFSTPATSG
jgi:starch phosphorylase